MSDHFEDRHRALCRAAGGYPYADDAAAAAAERAEDALRDFYGRTGPLVDDLVAAVRRWTERGADQVQLPVSAEFEFRNALAALDEASRG